MLLILMIACGISALLFIILELQHAKHLAVMQETIDDYTRIVELRDNFISELLEVKPFDDNTVIVAADDTTIENVSYAKILVLPHVKRTIIHNVINVAAPNFTGVNS